MADLVRFEKDDGKVLLTFSLSADEYGLVKESEDDVRLLPVGEDCFNLRLTTGQLGNGNRLMLPNKMLERNEIDLIKKIPSRIFDIGGEKYLLCKLAKKKGVPHFKE